MKSSILRLLAAVSAAATCAATPPLIQLEWYGYAA